MKLLFVVGLVVLILAVLSFFVRVPHAEHHGVSAGDVQLGITTHHEDRVPPALSIILVVVGAAMMIAGGTKELVTPVSVTSLLEWKFPSP